MKQNTIKLWLVVAAFLSLSQIVDAGCSVSQTCTTPCTPCSSSKNTWFPRPFSSNASVEIAQEKTVFQTESNRDEWNGTLSFATSYMQNFGAKCPSCQNLGSMPFWGAAGTNTMTIGNNDGLADVDGYNFFMGNIETTSGIGGTISLNPKITQAGADFLLYFTHHKDKHGLFFKVHAPISALIMNVQMTESGTELDEAYFGQTTAAPANVITYNTDYPNQAERFTSLSSAFAGGLTNGNALGGKPDMAMAFGKLSACKQTEIRLADLSATIGYNLCGNDKGILGVGFKLTCATGTTPDALYALEPIVGRAGLWGVGGEIMGHYKAWENDAQTRYVDFWLQGEALHLVPGRRPSMRSFDLLANGAGSKYILLRHFKTSPNGVVAPDGLTQAINVTTLPVFSKFAAEGNLALMADFHCNNWNLAVGGEFWGRTKETLSIDLCSTMEQARRNLNEYGVAGRQAESINVQTNATNATGVGQIQGMSFLVEPAAKINKSQDMVLLVGNAAAPNVPTFPAAADWPTGIEDGTVSTNRIPSNLAQALDICGAAAAKAFTGKVFGQLGYTWCDNRYTPNVSFIGSAEFTNKTNNMVNMWSAGIQGSLNF